MCNESKIITSRKRMNIVVDFYARTSECPRMYDYTYGQAKAKTDSFVLLKNIFFVSLLIQETGIEELKKFSNHN